MIYVAQSFETLFLWKVLYKYTLLNYFYPRIKIIRGKTFFHSWLLVGWVFWIIMTTETIQITVIKCLHSLVLNTVFQRLWLLLLKQSKHSCLIINSFIQSRLMRERLEFLLFFFFFFKAFVALVASFAVFTTGSGQREKRGRHATKVSMSEI